MYHENDSNKKQLITDDRVPLNPYAINDVSDGNLRTPLRGERMSIMD
jgi:hypothetical protein